MNFNVDPNAPKTVGGGFNLPLTTSVATPATTMSTTGFSLPLSSANKLATTTSSGSAGLQLPVPAAATSATASVSFSMPNIFPLGGKLPSTTPVTSSIPFSTVGTSAPLTLATTNVVSSAPLGTNTSLNFCQLEEGINKWTLELEEQEKVFLNQATHVNAWDRVLIANGEKIVGLNSSVERVKMEQQQLDNELDFILVQQRELEDCLLPLEKELDSSGLQDPEREQTYLMAENMDTQLKQMSEDLKEIIEHLNEANQSQDNNDPIVQIGRILNAHMNSLQWIDQNTSLISTHLDQVAKLNDVYRRETERSFHLTYE